MSPSLSDPQHAERHKSDSGAYVKSIIYGGMDGIVSVFVSVAAVEAGSTALGVVMLLGLAKMIAGAISMGVGDWMSTAADVDFAKNERRREQWECDNYLEGEVEEMVELYVKKGLKEETARRLIDIVSTNPKLFVDMMMVDELGILPEEESDIPWKHGVVNFGSFLVFGVIPLLGYVVYLASGANQTGQAPFGVSIALTGATLMAMGVIKAKLTGTNIPKSAITTLLFGGIGAVIGWLVSFLLKKWTGLSID